MDQGAPGPTVGAETAGLTLCGQTGIRGTEPQRMDPSVIRWRRQVVDPVPTALGRLHHPFWIARLYRRVAGAEDQAVPIGETKIGARRIRLGIWSRAKPPRDHL